jgi:hypothetical protein
MKRPCKQVEIHGQTFEVVQLSPLSALELLPEFARLFGPVAEALLGDGIMVGDKQITLLDLADGGDLAREATTAIIRSVTVTLGKQRGADLRRLAVECCRGAKLHDVRIRVDEEKEIIETIIDAKIPSVAALATLVWHQALLIALPSTAGDAT